MTPEHPSDPASLLGRVSAGPFSYTDEGSGPIVVALHGLPGSARDFRWLAPGLSGIRLLRIEQPGFGGTPVSTERGVSLAARAGFVLRALDAIGVDRFFVLGHSMGGPLAMATAASAVDRALGVVLLSSVGLRPHRLVRKIGRRRELSRVLDVPLLSRLVLPVMRAGYRRAGFPASTPDSAIVMCQRVFAMLSFSDVRAAARNVRCKSLLAWAEDDPLVEPTIGLELANALPPGPRLAFGDGGHNIQKSRAIELAEAIASFVATGEQI